MTKSEKNMILDILDEEWEFLSMYDLKHRAPVIQYAAAIWTLLETIPARDRILGLDD